MKILSEKEKNSKNCVKWVRDRVKNLPFGLITLEDKKKIIDTKNAKRGRVPIMDTGTKYGHIGIVRNVDKKQITIIEANYIVGKITSRTGTKKELNILGFFNPEKKRWQPKGVKQTKK